MPNQLQGTDRMEKPLSDKEKQVDENRQRIPPCFVEHGMAEHINCRTYDRIDEAHDDEHRQSKKPQQQPCLASRAGRLAEKIHAAVFSKSSDGGRGFSRFEE